MYNSETPLRAELPSSRQLLRSTVIAAITAAVLLITVVLPADFGLDPTGVGRVLGLTEMGEIKTRLTAEAKADAAAAATSAAPAATVVPMASANSQTPPAAAVPVAQGPAATPVVTQSSEAWRDVVSFTLAPGVGTEVKLKMKEGERALFDWAVEGGVVNYDTHGDGGGRSISYVKGRGVQADKGELVAAFTGNHG